MQNLLPRACPLCGNYLENPVTIADITYEGKPGHKFFECRFCQVAFLHPMLTKEEEYHFYSMEFEKFMEKRSGGDFDWSGPEAHMESNRKQYERRCRFFDDLLLADKSVLEIGCSSGFMLLPLQQKRLRVMGVEPSRAFSGFLASRGLEVYQNLGDLTSSCDINQFDLVLHFFVLEHVRDPKQFLFEAFKLVKPGGYMVFEVPNRNDPLITVYNIDAFNKFYWTTAHNYYFNHKSLNFIVSQITIDYEIINEQRYDLSNHITWALTGKPGGHGKYSGYYTEELEKAYKNSMIKTGLCDTLICRLHKPIKNNLKESIS